MLSPRWHKVLADLWASKTRTILAALSIAVGVFAIGMVLGAQHTMTRDLSRGYLAVNPAHAWIFTSYPFEDELLTTVRRTPGVAAVEGMAAQSVRLKVGEKEWRTFYLMAAHDFEEMVVNKLRSVEGAWPPDEGEVLLERSALTLVDFTVGDTMNIELSDGKKKTLHLSGLAHNAAGIPAYFANEVDGFVTFDTLEKLGFPRMYTQMYVTVGEGSDDLEQIKAVVREVEKRIERSGRTAYTYIPPPGESPVNSGLQAMGMVTTTLGVLMIFLSTFLIVNTVSALLLQQRRHIGVMKSIGARADQMAAMYLGYVICLGLLALLFAVPLGALAGHATASFMARLLNFDPSPFELVPWVIMLQAIIAITVPMLAAVMPIISGVRISVREAISNPGLGRGVFGSRGLDRLLEHIRFLSRPLLISLRNTFRRKGRLALTLITLTLGGAIFMGVQSTQAAIVIKTDELMNFFGEDVRVSFARPYRIDQIRQVAAHTAGVARTEVWAFAKAYRIRPDESEGNQVFIQGPPVGTDLMKPQLLRGRWMLPEDANAIVVDTTFLKDEQDVDVGSVITLKLDDRETLWTVVGVVPQPGNGPAQAYANYSYMSKLLNNVGYASNLRIVATQHDTAFQKQLAERLEGRYKNDAGMLVSEIRTSSQYRISLDKQFKVITDFLMQMAVLIALVGGIGLMGTMSMNVVERTREIGVLRAIGASDGAVQQIVIVEGVLIGLLSWLAGLAAAVPIGRLLGDGIGMGFLRSPLPHTFSWNGVLLWLGIVISLAMLASFLPAWNASRLTVRDVLSYE